MIYITLVYYLGLLLKKDHSSFCVSLHYVVVKSSRITFCPSHGLATYCTPLQSSFQALLMVYNSHVYFQTFTCKK